jgi:hypothetical protein
LQKKNRSLPFPFSVYIYIQWIGHIYIYNYIYTSAAILNGKLKSRWFFLIHVPFSHHANWSLSFVCLFTKKQTEVIRLQAD